MEARVIFREERLLKVVLQSNFFVWNIGYGDTIILHDQATLFK